ncbi:SDR family NAD(P)-dependent oxidoreductase [Microbacterium sp.]|uniref:SDR family NAD(P)-dependent oxidoreductase n=1 Tax=Microbacterium sp. TaxID=51671 RepID=UPI003221413F
MARDAWDPEDLPDLTGRRFLVTGSNAGIGFFSSLQLAAAGAHVIMTGRNPNRLAAARAAVLAQYSDARVETLLLDTSNLGSVRAAAATARGRTGLAGLLLNAGIVHAPREREVTHDGHEIVFATNVLGHYALAGELLTALAAGRGRMVWLGSISTSFRALDPEDLDFELERDYTPWRAYVQSKVAAAALGLEADRRLHAARVPVASVVAHPGYAIGGRTRTIEGVNDPTSWKRFTDGLQAPIARSKEIGAEAIVRALIDPHVESGEYWGPSLMVRGAPRASRPPRIVRDPELAARLWDYCERVTRMSWPYLKASKTRRR